MTKELHFVLQESSSCSVVNKLLKKKNKDDIFEFSLSSINLIKQISEFIFSYNSRS